MDGERIPATRSGRRSAKRRRVVSLYTISALVVISGVAAAFAGAHPTDLAAANYFYAAALGGLVPLAASRASRESVIVLAGIATAMSRNLLWVPSAAALAVAFAAAWSRRRTRRTGALVGALSVQCALRWPEVAFHGATALVAALAFAPVAVSAYLALGRRGRKVTRLVSGGVFVVALFLAVPFLVGVIAARGAVDRGIAQAKTALDDATAGGQAATTAINLASADLASAARSADPWWTAGAELLPVEAQQRAAVVAALSAARSVTEHSLGVADQIGAIRNTYHDGTIDLASLEAIEPQVKALASAFTRAQSRLAGAQSQWLAAPLASKYDLIVSRLASAGSSVHLADQAIPLLPGLLGDHGTRHYLVVFMTPSESRGLDGFIGSYAELAASNGHLSLTRSGQITQLSGYPGVRHISGYTQYMARYGTYDPAKYLQDVSYSPDFPTVAGVLGQLYPQAGGQPVDGVLALDPFGLAALLDFTGPISVPGLPVALNAQNAAQELTLGQYEQASATNQLNGARHDALQTALQVAFEKLTSGSLPSPRALSAALDPAVRDGRIMFWPFRKDEQSLATSLGISGAFPSAAGGDLVGVTTGNADNNKIDAFLTKTVTDQVVYNPGNGAESATVTVTLHNSAPAAGLPGYLIGSYPNSHIPPGANLTWLTLYSPLQLASATQDGTPLPVSDQPELGVHAYGGFVLVGSGQTVTLTYHLQGELAKSDTYSLVWRTQPAVNPDMATVEVAAPGGWKARSTSKFTLSAGLVERLHVAFAPS